MEESCFETEREKNLPTHDLLKPLIKDGKCQLITLTFKSTAVLYPTAANASFLISAHFPPPHRATPSTNVMTSRRVHGLWCFRLVPPLAVGTVATGCSPSGALLSRGRICGFNEESTGRTGSKHDTWSPAPPFNSVKPSCQQADLVRITIWKGIIPFTCC